MNLILASGSSLSTDHGIYLEDGARLTIWGQNRDPSQDGVINATNEYVEASYWSRRSKYGVWYEGYIMAPALGGGLNFTLTINGGQINATANREGNTSPAVGCSGDWGYDGAAEVTVNRGILKATVTTGDAPAIGIGFGAESSFVLNVNGGTVTANQTGSNYAIGNSPLSPLNSAYVNMYGGSLTAECSKGAGISAGITYRGGTLTAKGGVRALTEAPDLTNVPHVTTSGGRVVESTGDPKTPEQWTEWKDVTINLETLTGDLRGPDAIVVNNGSVTDPIQITWNGQPWSDKVYWLVPDGFSMDENSCLHVGDNVAIGTHTIIACYGDRTVAIQVTVNAKAAYYNPDSGKTYPVPRLQDASTMLHGELDSGWYYVTSYIPNITVKDNASINLLLMDSSDTLLTNVTLGQNATLTIWCQEGQSGKLTFDYHGSVSAGDGSVIVIKGGIIDATDADVNCPIYLRNGVVAMVSAPAAGITATGGSLKLTDAEGATVKNQVGEELIPVTLPNPDSAVVIIDGQQYLPGNHTGLDSADTDLHPWLTAADHSVQLGDESFWLLYDEQNKTFQRSDILAHSYYDPLQHKSIELTEYTVVTENTTEMNGDTTGGWYVVEQSVTVSQRIVVRGDVNLVLAGGLFNADQGINVDQGNSLTIWSTETGYTGQAPGWAALRAKSGEPFSAGIGAANYWYSMSGDITINGGRIDAVGGYFGGSGIGGGANTGEGRGPRPASVITINAGTVCGIGGGLEGYAANGAGIGAVEKVVINGGTVTACGHRTAGISANGAFYVECRINLIFNGGTLYSSPTNYFRSTYNVIGDVTNSAGQPLYLLKLYNPDGKRVLINASREWYPAVHAAGLSETPYGYEEGYLYAYVPLDDDNLVHVELDGQTYTYAPVDGNLQLVNESALDEVDYYDPMAEETRTAEHVAKFSTELNPDENGVIHVRGNEAFSWFLADEPLDGQDLLISGKVDLILQDDVELRSNVFLEEGASLTIWSQEGQTGKLTASEHSGPNSGNLAPGILLGNGSYLTINGGVIDSTGGDYRSPGIGSLFGASGNITINGGTITARGGANKCGIGGDNYIVTINGGTVTAIGGQIAEGIGSLYSLDVTINGGNVTAIGGKDVPGIGVSGFDPISLHINGGVVKAVGGPNATGIGAKRKQHIYGESILCFSGGTITAEPGSSYSVGVDAPLENTVLIIACDSVKIDGEENLPPLQPYNQDGEPVYLLKLANPDGLPVSIDGKPWPVVNHDAQAHDDDTNLYLYLPGRDVQVQLGTDVQEYAFDSQTQTFVPKIATEYYDLDANGTVSCFAVPMTTEHTVLCDGWYVFSGDRTIDDRRITVQGDVNLILADGCKLYLAAGLSVNEGSSLTIWGQEGQTGQLTSNGAYAFAGIGGDPNKNAGDITINGGVVIAKGGKYGAGIGGGANGAAGNITINYGSVTASVVQDSHGFGGAAIGTGWDNLIKNYTTGAVTITGGTVSATGAGIDSPYGGSAGIGTGDWFPGGVAVTITGGTVTATGGAKAYGIGAGHSSRNTGGSITITGGSVNASSELGPVNPRPTNGSENVYLLTLPNPGGAAVTLGDQSWSPVNHQALGGDTNLYAYIPGADVIAKVGDTQTQYCFENDQFTTKEEYDWESGTWTWADDCASATFNVPRKDAPDQFLSRTVFTSVTAETKPTCEESGNRTYTAQITIIGETYTDTRTVDADPATGHTWDVTGRVYKPTLEEDGRTVTVYCLNGCGSIRTALLTEEENTAKYVAPNCGTKTDGARFYDRTFTLDGEQYPFDEISVSVPWSHDWGEWQEISTEAVVTLFRECNNCDATEESDHWHQWQLPSNEPFGDANPDVEWKLGPTEYGVTVHHVTCSDPDCEFCAANGGMDVPLDPSLLKHVDSMTTKATCDTAGSTVYAVTLELPEKDGTVSKTYYSRSVPLPPEGHQWGEPEFTFEKNAGDPYDANETCTLTLHCVHAGCNATQTVEDIPVTGKVTAEPTCEDAGVMTVTAETVYEGETYTSASQTRSIPALGHDYSTATVEWAADHASAVVTLTCARDETHIATVTASGDDITQEVTEPTCESQGATTYTVNAAQAIADANITYTGNTVFSDMVRIPATGHNWDVEGKDYPLAAGVDGDYTTLTIFCLNDPTHTQTVYPELELVGEIQEPTCTQEGSETYQMTFEFNGHQEVEGEAYPIPMIPHQWGEWELVTATARASEGEVWQRTCSVCGETETANHQHEYILSDSANWDVINGKPMSVTVEAICQSCGEREMLTYYGDSIKIDAERSEDPTCSEAGRTVYTVTAEIGGKSRTYTNIQPVSATGHQWVLKEGEGGLSDDHSMYTFVFECSVCYNTTAQTVATVSEVLTPATCEEPGRVQYRADTEMNGKPYSFTGTGDIPAQGHDWDAEGTVEPPLLETEDGFVTVTIYCKHDHSHTQTVYATLTKVEEESKAATCTEPGTDVYALSYAFGFKTYDLTQRVQYAIPALGHLWDESTHTCSRCGAAEPSHGDVTYTWDLPDPAKDPGDSSRIQWSQPPAGGKPYLTVTAYRNGSDGSSEKVEIVVTEVTADEHLSCEQPGSITYSAKVEVDDVSMTYTTTGDLPPTGHLWTFDEKTDVVWSDDNTTATFTLRCKNAWHTGADAKTQTVVVGAPSVTPATCEGTGTLVYTASAQLDGFTVTASKTETLAALGHDWSEWTAAWSEDDSTVTFTFICSHDESHTKPVTATAKRETWEAAGCTSTGKDRLSASYTLGSVTATDEKFVDTPALGHDFVNGVCSRCGEKEPEHVQPTATPAATAAPTAAAAAPNTGDGTDLLAWTALLLACAAALTAVLGTRRRKQ